LFFSAEDLESKVQT